MFRSLLALIVLSFLAADASACGTARAGLFRGRVRDHVRIVHRERHVTRGSCAAVSGVVVVPAAVVPCPAGKCPAPAKK